MGGVPNQRPVAVRAVVVAALVLVWLAMLLVHDDFELAILRATHVGEGASAAIAVFVTSLGDWGFLLALPFFGAVWLIYRHRWRTALFLIGAALLGRLAVEVQKVAFARVRPDMDHPLVAVHTFGFPSGHSANSMIVYLLLACLVMEGRRHRRMAIAIAVGLSLAIGLSRIALGVHWPTDVIGGWAFGLLWVLLVLPLAQRLER